MGAACAFPSWPKGTSLSTEDTHDSFTNAYLSDEDLLWMPENAGAEPPELDEEATKTHEMISSMTMEQQLARMRAVAEEEDRLRFLAKVEAHARATQAIRQTKLAMYERDNSSSTKRNKKRRVVPTPKRRAHSSSARVSTVTH
jgi:hypothetical protein